MNLICFCLTSVQEDVPIVMHLIRWAMIMQWKWMNTPFQDYRSGYLKYGKSITLKSIPLFSLGGTSAENGQDQESYGFCI